MLVIYYIRKKCFCSLFKLIFNLLWGEVYRGVSTEQILAAFQTWGPHCRFAAVPVKVAAGPTASAEWVDGSAWFAAIAGPRDLQPGNDSGW